ncbi:uncharacterized protein LOC144121139 isoform X6 [Amblyomma americanum]
MKQVYLSYYATPVLVGALCNIMPSSVPTALLHDLSRMLFSKLVIRGCADKEEEPPSSPGHRLPIGDKKSSQGIGPNAAVPLLLHQLQHVLKGSM